MAVVVAIVIDGMPIWGSDVGGVLAFVPAVGVTAARVLGQRVRWRAVAFWGSLAVLVVGVLIALRPVARTPCSRSATDLTRDPVGARTRR